VPLRAAVGEGGGGLLSKLLCGGHGNHGAVRHTRTGTDMSMQGAGVGGPPELSPTDTGDEGGRVMSMPFLGLPRTLSINMCLASCVHCRKQLDTPGMLSSILLCSAAPLA
jgi:hypothetical protein